MPVGMAPAPLSLPRLGVEIEEAGHGDLGEQLGRRQLLRRAAEWRGRVALGHPQGVVDDDGGIDLHGDGMGLAG